MKKEDLRADCNRFSHFQTATRQGSFLISAVLILPRCLGFLRLQISQPVSVVVPPNLNAMKHFSAKEWHISALRRIG